MPDKEPSADEDLKDGGVDEAANRRAFLAALYEWRNGGKPAGENDEEKDNSSGGPEAREGGMGNTRVKIHEQDDKGRKIVAEKTLSKNLPQRQLSAHAAAVSAPEFSQILAKSFLKEDYK